ncbi:major facilitator superfamily MFS_1 [Segniliparus rotundus DSM 44985]|uniref:Major facilitator superfamily MFS_1 n=1 Tax=Segniliparus rotundus (strain ATCC BAA-972 / CDC 1076 / CIP 108378 / DSM 44985 / JCM 13578) TaxID=640132 RepID=D6Z910_SEGRD|nr:MFS transporter [Segniliparus rotundus]ADG98440.1 major facilitator superfamily MFS_1 [Segniliparus rotundus DSM 44985]
MTNSGEGFSPEFDQTGPRPVEPAAKSGASNRGLWPVLAIGGATQFVLNLDTTIMSVALPQVQGDLQLNDPERTSVIAFYVFFHGLFLLLGGRAVDSWGPRRAFLIGIAGFGVVSMLGGGASNASELLVARSAQGSFAALLAPAVLALVSNSFAGKRERAFAFVVIGTTAVFGTASGLVLGGMLAQYASWRWCLLVNVPLALLIFYLVLFLLQGGHETGRRGYDLFGSALSIVAFFTLGVGIYHVEAERSRIPVFLCLALFVVFTWCFVFVEQHAPAPLTPPSVLLDRTCTLASLGNAFTLSGVLGGTLFLATYMEKLRGYNPSETGLRLLPILAGILIGGLSVAKLSEWAGIRALSVVGSLLAATGMLLFSRISPDDDYATRMLPMITVFGLGLGVLSVCLPDLALVGVRNSEAGSASAMFTAYGQIGGALGTAFLSQKYASAKHFVAEGGQAAELVGCTTAFFVAGMTLACVAPVVLFARPKAGAHP